MKKVVKKIFFYLFLTIAVVMASSVIATFLYKDQLINQFIAEANKRLNTPISVGKISVSSLSNFPQVSLQFDDVLIEESFEKSTAPLIEAEQISFSFNPIEAYRGDYSVKEILIKGAKCHLKIDKNGVNNYSIIKASKDSTQNNVAFDLSSIAIYDTEFKYSDFRKAVFLETYTEKTTSSLIVKDHVYSISAIGTYDFKNLQSRSRVFLSEKRVEVESKLQYNHSTKSIDFDQSNLKINNGAFIVSGNYTFLDAQVMNFDIKGLNTDIQTLTSLLPPKYMQNLDQYQSRGEVYFSMSVNGELSDERSPALNVKFGLKEAEIFHPNTEARVQQAYADGTFKMADMSRLVTASLELKNINASLEDQQFTGSLLYQNFSDPRLNFNFDGKIDMNSLFKFYQTDAIKSATGAMDLNVSFEGRLKDLKKKSGMSKLKASGEIDLLNVFLEVEQLKLPIENLNGNLLFNNNDLALSDVSGKLGNSDFKLNGFFKNVIAYLLLENEPVGIESELKSRFIDMDQLLAANESQGDNSTGYTFSISNRLRLKFNCDVKSLKFRRLRARNIKGDLKVKNRVALTEQIKFDALGGSTTLAGLVDANNSEDIQVTTSFKLDNINIDSAFYVFENFNQDFLEDRHLKGKIFADVEAEMDFDDELDLYSETLTANISTSIKNGQLNNFEPMQRLSNYLDEDQLDHLVFSELNNNIHIENKIIYLPTMQVGTNVTDIRIGGTHSFDQRIDYHVVAPLRSKKKIDPDEAFGAIEEDNQGRSQVYLKIVGTTSDYRVLYDKQAVKQKIISDLKKEVNELKKAFKEKGLKKTKTIELEEDDYFDWDDDH